MINTILQAREQRSLDRLILQSEGLVGISLSLNMAGWPKSTAVSQQAFKYLQKDLEVFLTAHRVILATPIRFDTDAAGNFYLAGVSYSQHKATAIKNITETFEETHPLHRLIDVDVMDTRGKMISSHKQKKCLLCKQAAKVCAHSQAHPIEDIRAYSEHKLETYLQQCQRQTQHNRIAEAATQALLYELSLSPKPGLVHKNGSGAHKDMDFLSFVNSIAALTPYWQQLCLLASNEQQYSIEHNTTSIRQLGLRMEQAMLTSTQGINTHKGAIFALGYLCYLSALQPANKALNTEKLQQDILRYHQDSMQDSLLHQKAPHSHGKKIYNTYGATNGGGARQQMAYGLPIVFKTALPYLETLDKNRQLFSGENHAESVLKKVLLLIMSKNADSNILHRSDLQTLKKLQQLSLHALKKDEHSDKAYTKICDFCSEKNISPGGSADMLAATIFVYKLKHF